MSDPFLAEVRIVGFNFAPRGWAQCDGQFLPIAQNQALYSLLGTTYGGDGRTTFALPDLRGRAAAHPGPDLRLGQSAGQETVSLTEAQIPAHSHTLQASTDIANNAVPADALPAARGRGGPLLYAAPGPTVAMHPAAVSVTGGQPHDNMQPFLALNFVIALQGLFPSRS